VVFKPAGLFALAATAAVNMDGAVPVIHGVEKGANQGPATMVHL